MATVEDVKKFWENNPLFTGESHFPAGSHNFFKECREIHFDEYFANSFDEKLFIPKLLHDARVLDLGCGIGFWTIELLMRGGYKNFWACDLTQSAIDLTRKRLAFYGFNANLCIENAENLSFPNDFFDHVNCQGVIHHTPDTEAAIREIARVLKPGGTAYISVYYKNLLVRNWSKISVLGNLLCKLGIGLKGRGRESICLQADPDNIVRTYDGTGNPVGKCYMRAEIINMVKPYFNVEKVFKIYFPCRSLPVKLPRFLRKFLSDNLGFLIHLNLRKK